jgi:hypothetical protein
MDEQRGEAAIGTLSDSRDALRQEKFLEEGWNWLDGIYPDGRHSLMN